MGMVPKATYCENSPHGNKTRSECVSRDVIDVIGGDVATSGASDICSCVVTGTIYMSLCI